MPIVAYVARNSVSSIGQTGTAMITAMAYNYANGKIYAVGYTQQSRWDLYEINITGMAATNCFGVKGMAYRSMTDGLVHLLRREAMSKGVSITYHDDNSISIELHIIVENGLMKVIKFFHTN